MTHGTPPSNDSPPYSRSIPRPTMHPMLAAFGVTLIFAGIVTHPFVSVIGAIAAVAGVVGWFREVFPHEQTEEIPVAQCDVPLPAPTIAPKIARAHSPRRIVPHEIHPYRSGLYGGLAGGLAMAFVACLWGVVAEHSLWMPINLLAGMLMPSVSSASLDELKVFSLGWTVAAVCIHLALSVMVGMIFVVALPMMPRRPMIAGGILAPLIWTGAGWAAVRVIDPALDDYISFGWFLVSQAAFGVACGAVVTRFNRVRLQVGNSLAMRLDVEQSEGGSK